MVYSLAAHILGEGRGAEAVTEEVFVRAWRVSAPTGFTSSAAPDHEHVGDAPAPLDALTWLLRLTRELAIARLSAAPQHAIPGLGRYDAGLSPRQVHAMSHVLWGGETAAAVALDTDRAALDVARELGATMTQMRSAMDLPTAESTVPTLNP